MVMDPSQKTEREIRDELKRQMRQSGILDKNPTIESTFRPPTSDILSFKIRHDP